MIQNIFKVVIAVALTFITPEESYQEVVPVILMEPEVVEVVIELSNTPWHLDNEYHCLASNIYWEARNQPFEGKIAVAQVTLNRVESSSYPDTICDVVTQTRFYPSGKIDLHSCQFSWYCDGLKDEPVETWGFSYEESFELAVMFLQERPTDVTEGSTHYHSTKVSPFWTASLEEVVKIDEHIFYK